MYPMGAVPETAIGAPKVRARGTTGERHNGGRLCGTGSDVKTESICPLITEIDVL
jgi:hypothetical protein